MAILYDDATTSYTEPTVSYDGVLLLSFTATYIPIGG